MIKYDAAHVKRSRLPVHVTAPGVAEPLMSDHWSGVNGRTFLERIGADLTASNVNFRCADGYTSSCDMAIALYPQAILATKYARKTLADPFGTTLPLWTATKLGFKIPKGITGIEVRNTQGCRYWQDRGYNLFSGI